MLLLNKSGESLSFVFLFVLPSIYQLMFFLIHIYTHTHTHTHTHPHIICVHVLKEFIYSYSVLLSFLSRLNCVYKKPPSNSYFRSSQSLAAALVRSTQCECKNSRQDTQASVFLHLRHFNLNLSDTLQPWCESKYKTLIVSQRKNVTAREQQLNGSLDVN